jgi:pyruvate dehydrogenase E1 component beta subunit
VAYGAMMRVARQAVELAAKEGLSVELIDLRGIYPLDTETLLESVRKTGRLAVLHEGPTSFGVAAEIIARVNEQALMWLEAPPRRIGGFDTVMPLPMGEQHYMPSPERVLYELIQLHSFPE